MRLHHFSCEAVSERSLCYLIFNNNIQYQTMLHCSSALPSHFLPTPTPNSQFKVCYFIPQFECNYAIYNLLKLSRLSSVNSSIVLCDSLRWYGRVPEESNLQQTPLWQPQISQLSHTLWVSVFRDLLLTWAQESIELRNVRCVIVTSASRVIESTISG